MSKDSMVDLTGIITKIIPGGKFEVTVKNEKGGDMVITCHPSGKLRMNAEGRVYENMGSFFFAGKTLTFMETIIFLGGINYGTD